MACSSIFVELADKGVDKESIENIALYANSIREAEIRAKKTGKYVDPEKRVDFSLDGQLAKKLTEKYKGLVGKTIPIFNTTDNSFKDTKIKNVDGVDRSTVNINGVRYDVRTGLSLDGSKEVMVLGSEINHSTEGYNLTNSTVIKSIDDLLDHVEDVMGNDDRLSEVHADRLADVVNSYVDAIEKAHVGLDITVDTFEDLLSRDDEFNRGYANPTTGKIKLMFASNKWASRTEILAHELQHVLIENVMTKELKFQIGKLQQEMRAALVEKYNGKPYKAFLAGIENVTSEDVVRAKSLFEYAFDNTKNPESEFLAYVTTNENMINEVGSIKYTDNLLGRFDGDGRLVKIANKIIDIINRTYNGLKYGKGATGHDVAIKLMKHALELRAQQGKVKEAGILDNVNSWLTEGDEKVRGLTGNIEKGTQDLRGTLKDSINKPDLMKKFIRKIWGIKGMTKVRSVVLQNSLFSSISRDMENKDVAKFYSLFRQSKALIDKTEHTIKRTAYSEIVEHYGLDKVSEGTRRAAKRVLLDTDYRAIGSIDEVAELIGDESKLTNSINESSVGLKDDTIKAAKALANVLVTNVSDVKDVYINANQIASLVEGNADGKTVKQIDKLVSLYALKGIGKEDKALVAKELVEGNKAGIEATMKVYYAHVDELVNTVYDGNSWTIAKGMKQEEYIDDKKYYLVEQDEMLELTSKTKMVNIGLQEDLSKVLGQDVYLVIGDNLDTTYSEGLLSTVQLKNEGESLKSIIKKFGINDPDTIQDMMDREIEVGSKLIPERSMAGEIVDYRFRIPQEVKEQYLGLDNDIAKTVSHTIANLTRKDNAVINNRNALSHLVSFYDKYKNDPDMNFLKVDGSEKNKFKEYWSILPGYLKNDLKRLTGEEALYIEEGMLTDFFGYKDASISNLVNNKRWKLGLLKTEKAMKEVVQYWKKIIVTMTGSTIRGNLASNMFVTLNHLNNKNPIAYADNFKDIWEQLNTYQRDSREIHRLKIRQSAGEDISDARIKSLEVRMSNNPVHEIMADGQYSVILEDIDLDFYESKGLFAQMVKGILDKAGKSKDTRESVKKVFDELYLTNDSKVYKKLLKLTQYADVINRIMIHNDNMKHGKMSNTESLTYVDGLFVNYAYLDNKYVKYMNDLGFVTFTKYFFRTMPALLKMAALKPVTLFFSESSRNALNHVGVTDVESPWDQVYSPVDTLSRKLLLWDEPMNVLQAIFTPNITKPI